MGSAAVLVNFSMRAFMHYAIQHQSVFHPHLAMTARKKMLKSVLLRVEQGLVLLRLGKKEYALEPGQCAWLPFDCLCAITYLPNTRLQSIELSSRVRLPMPEGSGYVLQSELCQTIIDRLAKTDTPDTLKADLLQVLRHEISNLKPTLTSSSLSQKISQWQPGESSKLSKEMQLTLLMREVKKRQLSGIRKDAVIQDLFAGDEAAYTQAFSAVFGE